MTGSFGVRRATAADLDRVTDIVSAAFARDPLWAHAMALPGGGAAHHREFWRLFVEGALRYPWSWLTSGGEAVAIWIPPGGTEMTPEQEQRLEHLATGLLGPAADGYLELLRRFDAAHPRAQAHYYLSLLATDPAHRGKGIGMRLLAHDLDLIDAEHRPAYLESSNPANDRRYASVGFQPHGEFSYPGGGPVVTTMWRPAR
jgi:GNAT superfamily N-acetyltransferase